MSRGWHSTVDLRIKAGWKLFHNFIPPYSQLSPRKPQLTPTAIAKVFTPENILALARKDGRSLHMAVTTGTSPV
jgi:hypothetical protein